MTPPTSMKVPLFGVERENRSLHAEISAALERVLASGRFILGPEGAEFERELALFIGAPFGLGVASGTDALVIALRALGVGPGDEVVTTPFTFGATAGAVALTGARPVFADIDPATFNLSPEAVRAEITSRTRAILAVHLFGQPADMDALMAIGRDANVPVVEDAAQAIGAAASGRGVGSIGAVGTFSFYPTKNLGGIGDGGFISTCDPKLAARIKLLREHGSPRRYHYAEIGTNSRLDELQAAALRVKLKRLPEWTEKRRWHARFYGEALAGLPSLETPRVPPGMDPAWHLYVVRVKDNRAVAEALESRGISCGLYYPEPLHLQPAYAHLGYRKGDLPEAERACREALSLPMSPFLTDEERDAVVAAVRDVTLAPSSSTPSR
jgi:dTDP-4-amino-4,6-dideoxygalactose transaminase